MRGAIGVIGLLGALLFFHPAFSAEPPKEEDYYRWVNIPIPKDAVLEVGGIEELPGQKIAVSTRRGDIYVIDGALGADPEKVTFTKFASGLHEVLGVSLEKDGWLYATQRGELSRLKDSNGDGKADVVETVSDGWDISGDYHEYAFGTPFDKNGHAWIVLCLTGSFSSDCKYRGWCLRVDKEGRVIPTCSGIRSPGGIGFNAQGDAFYTDNQAPGMAHAASNGCVRVRSKVIRRATAGTNAPKSICTWAKCRAIPKAVAEASSKRRRSRSMNRPPCIFPTTKWASRQRASPATRPKASSAPLPASYLSATKAIAR
jgi:hypothetical protein